MNNRVKGRFKSINDLLETQLQTALANIQENVFYVPNSGDRSYASTISLDSCELRSNIQQEELAPQKNKHNTKHV